MIDTQSGDIVREYSTGGALTGGSAVVVPPRHIGVVIMDGKTLDQLPSGTHYIDPMGTPLLAQKSRMKSGQYADVPISAVVAMVAIDQVQTMAWNAMALLTKNREHGVTQSRIRGRVSFRVTDPGGFVSALLRLIRDTGKRNPAFLQASFSQQTASLLSAHTGVVASAALLKMKLAPEQAATAREPLRAAAGADVAQWMHDLGAQCLGFDIDEIETPQRTACVICKSTTAPTGFGVFRRTISLFVVRYSLQREGNFCMPCALKTSLSYNGLMLVAGWWGYIGLVMTPIFFVNNLYQLARIATGPKAAAGPLGVVAVEEAVWPPAPGTLNSSSGPVSPPT